MCTLCQAMFVSDDYEFHDDLANSQALTENAGDAAGNTSTIYSMTASDTFSGTISTTTDTDWIEISIPAGEQWEIDLTGDSGTTDPIVSLYDSGGGFLLNEQSYNGITSSLTYTNTSNTAETFYIQAADFLSNGTGDYTISITASTPAPLTVWTDQEIAEQLKNGYWSQFGFNNVAWDVSPGDTLVVDITRLTADGQFLATNALEAWTLMTGINFSIITDPAQALTENGGGYDANGSPANPGGIIFDDDESGAFANFQYSGSHTTGEGGTAGTIYNAKVNVSTGWLTTYGTELDTYSFQTYIHEIGHALGLGHGGDYNGSASYPADAKYLNDNWQKTVMSYFSQTENSDPSADGSLAYIVTPMVADIIAVQELYGVAGNLRTGDTTYGFNSTAGGYYDDLVTLTGSTGISFTILDDGGIDTLDLSGLTMALRIDLNDGAYSDVSGEIENLFIYDGTMIENFIGGSAGDSITGNEGDNTIDGRGGADSIDAGLGNDTIIASGGDSIDGGGGTDTISFESYATGGGGISVDMQANSYSSGDSVTGVENLIATDEDDFIRALDAGSSIDGRDGNDTLEGGIGDDTLIGGSGNDYIDFGGGSDSIHGGVGHDTIVFVDALSGVTVNLQSQTASGGAAGTTFASIESVEGSGFADNMTGDSGDNTLVGYSGNDTLNGSSGNDDLFGLGDDDVLLGGAGADSINGGGGTDTASYFNAGSGVSASLEAAGGITGDAAGDTYFSIENLFGSTHDDLLEGDADENTITGAAGNDTIFGGDGDDSLAGQQGNDLIFGDAGNDVIDGGSGADTVDYSASGAAFDLYLANTGGYAYGGDAEGDAFLNIENVIGTDHDDEMRGTTLINVFYGGDGNDTFAASNNNDEIYGGIGNDVINGGRGKDTIDGGDGIDTITYTNSDLRVIVDLESGTMSGSGHGGGDVISNVENIVGSAYNDILTGLNTGSTIDGFQGDDIINGGSGNDDLSGGAGNDTINGGQGDDMMFAGAGADVFEFTTLDFGEDTILGWQNSSDLLDFTALGLTINDFTVSQVGSDTVLTLDSDPANTITLLGINAGSITVDDFA